MECLAEWMEDLGVYEPLYLTMSPLESTIQIFLVASALGTPSFSRAMTRRWAMPMAACKVGV